MNFYEHSFNTFHKYPKVRYIYTERFLESPIYSFLTMIQLLLSLIKKHTNHFVELL